MSKVTTPPALVMSLGGASVACLLALSLLWPNYGKKHKETVQHGVQAISQIDEIQKLFPNATVDHFMTHFGVDHGKPVKWNTEVFFEGRYILHFHLRVWVDYDANRIKGLATQPQFYLKEVAGVSDGGEVTGAEHRFGLSEWVKIVEAKGDFRAAGIQIKSNAPVPGFEEVLRSRLAPRQK